MKVTRLLAVVLLISACSREPAAERTPATDRDGAVGTTGEPRTVPPPASSAAPAATGTSDAAAPTPRTRDALQDARAAAQGPVTQEAEQSGKNVPAAILKDFKDRIDDYVDVQKRAARDSPPLKESDDPARIKAAQDARMSAIRALRSNAKPGDIFTPEIRHTFRQLLAPDLTGEEGRDTRKVLRDDAPAPGAVPLEVNARYPENATLPTVPASLLTSLPELPKGLEYRIIGKDLILLDSDANLIVDYMRNVIR